MNGADDPGRITGLDRVGVIVHDLEAVSARYRRMGFTLTPLSRHVGAAEPGGPPVPFATGNRCVMLWQGYLELAALVDPDPALFRNRHDAFLACYAGAHMLAFRTEDAAAAERRIRAAGLAVAGTRDIQRMVETPQGPAAARFSLVFLDAAAMPEGYVIAIRHHTPEVLWQDRWIGHENGALALTELLIAVGDPLEAVPRYARLLGVRPVAAPDTARPVHRLELPAGRLAIVAAADLPAVVPGLVAPDVPYMAAFTLSVRNLEATRALLRTRGIACAEEPSRIVVSAAEAGGSALAFVQA